MLLFLLPQCARIKECATVPSFLVQSKLLTFCELGFGRRSYLVDLLRSQWLWYQQVQRAWQWVCAEVRLLFSVCHDLDSIYYTIVRVVPF